MKNIKCKILNCVNPLNKIEKGLGDLVLKKLNEKFKRNWINKKYGFTKFSDQEYKLSELVYYGTPMTGKFKRIYNELVKN